MFTPPPGIAPGPAEGSSIKAHNHLPVSGKANKGRRERWRRHIIKCAAGAIDQAAKLGEYGSWLFAVDIEFVLPHETKNDIDNLAKPLSIRSSALASRMATGMRRPPGRSFRLPIISR
jgi:hypothetical protein